MADQSGRATSPMPPWLRSMNRGSRPNRHGLAPFAASTNAQTSLLNHDHIQPQRHSSTPQHEPEPPATAHHIIPTPPSPAVANDNPVACAAKRKAPDVAPRDEEQRDCHSRHVATTLNRGGRVVANGGSMIWINENEGTKIMMDATRALKNPTRRVTVSGGEIHSKRARTAAIDSNDGESSRFLIPLYVVFMISRHKDRPFVEKENWWSATTSCAIRTA
jgi:hypothetical protein